jgi:ComF family protein
MDVVGLVEGLIGPARCEGCGARRGALCVDCRARVAAPVATESVPGVDRVITPWAYEGAARELILALKLRGNRAAAGPLIDAMRAAVLGQGLLGDTIVWVPGRRADRRRRGFDHAEVLGRGLARRLGLPARPLLVRVTNPPDQASLGAAARRRNLQGAFGATSCRAGIVVVDELVTTGSTGAACARALRAAGATGIELVAPCRA